MSDPQALRCPDHTCAPPFPPRCGRAGRASRPSRHLAPAVAGPALMGPDSGCFWASTWQTSARFIGALPARTLPPPLFPPLLQSALPCWPSLSRWDTLGITLNPKPLKSPQSRCWLPAACPRISLRSSADLIGDGLLPRQHRIDPEAVIRDSASDQATDPRMMSSSPVHVHTPPLPLSSTRRCLSNLINI